jgi:hypothetical protein
MGVDASNFNDIFLETFTVTTMDGRCVCVCVCVSLAFTRPLCVCSTVELYPGGADVEVTFESRHKFADMVIDFR